MTFREAYETAIAVAKTRGDSISLSVEAWHHHDLEGHNTMECFLWSCNEKRRYSGPSFDHVVEAYAKGFDAGRAKATSEALDAVGSP